MHACMRVNGCATTPQPLLLQLTINRSEQIAKQIAKQKAKQIVKRFVKQFAQALSLDCTMAARLRSGMISVANGLAF